MSKVNECQMRQTFDRYDADGSGYIEKKELRKAVSEILAPQNPSAAKIDEATEKIMKQVDTSGDGKISFEEFKAGFPQ